MKISNHLKKVRTCNGCKAFYQSLCSYSCNLGYNLLSSKLCSFNGSVVLRLFPEGGFCPKPLTYNQLFEASYKH